MYSHHKKAYARVYKKDSKYTPKWEQNPQREHHKERKEESRLDQVYFKGSLSTDFYSLDFCALMKFPLIL